MPVEDLKADPMMAHLVSSIERGEDVGHYGRLVFVMVGRHFMEQDELLEYLLKTPGTEEAQAKSLIAQVEARGYNPPKRERILEWMGRQEFPICESPEQPDQCNVYKNLTFPKQIYERIEEFYANKAEASGVGDSR
ncbi:MAG TPA: hypothetical protein VEQ63_10095 [Bryobacteraceae bacterium]|nr:hypothetical protein [Bryobacteraceae bacterium]